MEPMQTVDQLYAQVDTRDELVQLVLLCVRADRLRMAPGSKGTIGW